MNLLSFDEYSAAWLSSPPSRPQGVRGGLLIPAMSVASEDYDDVGGLAGLADETAGGAGEQPPRPSPGPGRDQDQDDDEESSSVAIEPAGCQCTGCEVFDSADCPIARQKGIKLRIRWARYRAKKVKKDGAKKK
eukprot:2346901-Pyramimonas_sp.AAC.1